MFIFMNTECEIVEQLLGACMSDGSTRTIYRFALKMITYLIAMLARILVNPNTQNVIVSFLRRRRYAQFVCLLASSECRLKRNL